MLTNPSEKALSATTTEKPDNVWHRRLGHLNRQGILLLKSKLATGLGNCEVSKDTCEVCVAGKHSKRPFKPSNKRSANLLDLIHSDLCGPMSTQSIGGARYFLTFIDDHSRKQFVYFLKNKNEVNKYFAQFKAKVENQLGKKIKRLRTDNGREYVNRELQEVLEKNGIEHQTTVAYNPQQNGLAERANRTIVERARTMLIDAGLPKDFWAETTATAVYLINRSPCKALQEETPEEAWSGRKPDLRHLKVFGCKALAHVPKEKRDKWDAKSEELIFVGYNESTKGYRLINPESRKAVNSRDVVFFEKHSVGKQTEIGKSELTVISFPESKEENHLDVDEDKPQNIIAQGGDNAIEGDEFYETSEDVVQVMKEDKEGPILRRSERKRKPVTREGYILYFAAGEESSQVPISLDEALKGPEREKWVRAMKEEYDSLLKNNT